MGPFHHRAHEGDLEPDRMLREVVDEIRKAEACRDKLEVLGGEEWLKIQDQILQLEKQKTSILNAPMLQTLSEIKAKLEDIKSEIGDIKPEIGGMKSEIQQQRSEMRRIFEHIEKDRIRKQVEKELGSLYSSSVNARSIYQTLALIPPAAFNTKSDFAAHDLAKEIARGFMTDKVPYLLLDHVHRGLKTSDPSFVDWLSSDPNGKILLDRKQLCAFIETCEDDALLYVLKVLRSYDLLTTEEECIEALLDIDSGLGISCLVHKALLEASLPQKDFPQIPVQELEFDFRRRVDYYLFPRVDVGEIRMIHDLSEAVPQLGIGLHALSFALRKATRTTVPVALTGQLFVSKHDESRRVRKKIQIEQAKAAKDWKITLYVSFV